MPSGIYQHQRRVAYVKFKCEWCGVQFEKTPGEVRQRKVIRFCGWECLKLGMVQKEKRTESKCIVCGKLYSILKSRAKTKRRTGYCSPACRMELQRQEPTKWSDPAQIKTYMREYVARNRKALNEKTRLANKRNPAQARARRIRWSKKNRPRLAVLAAVRRTRKAGGGGAFTVQEWEQLKKAYDYTCLACGKREPDIRLTTDHVISVFNGGSSFIDNIQPLCQPCNTSKGKGNTDYRLKEIAA